MNTYGLCTLRRVRGCFGIGIGLGLLLAPAFFYPSIVLSEEPEGDQVKSQGSEGKQGSDEKQSKVVKSGGGASDIRELKPETLATMGQYPEGRDVAVQTRGDSAEDAKIPLAGSVNRISDSECEVVVKNESSDASYMVRFSVDGQKQNGDHAFRRTFSARLKPGEGTKRTVPCGADQNVALKLEGGKKL